MKDYLTLYCPICKAIIDVPVIIQGVLPRGGDKVKVLFKDQEVPHNCIRKE